MHLRFRRALPVPILPPLVNFLFFHDVSPQILHRSSHKIPLNTLPVVSALKVTSHRNRDKDRGEEKAAPEYPYQQAGWRGVESQLRGRIVRVIQYLIDAQDLKEENNVFLF